MARKEIRPYVAMMVKLGVSVKARSSGFLKHYFTYGKKVLSMESDTPGMTWMVKRELFIKRTLAAYRKHRTPRRRLALIAWGYMV